MNTSKNFKFMQDTHNRQQQVALNSKMLEKYKRALKQCELILKATKQELCSLQNQLKQKNAIIDKLISQKQDHILHLYNCKGQSIKKQLQSSNKKNEQMKQKINLIVLKYELALKKNKQQIQRLKGFNKVLRIQNKILREDNILLKNSNNYHRNNSIGTISQSLSKKKQQQEQIYSFTVNSRDQTQFNPQKLYYQHNVQPITPQKITKRQLSKEISTQAQSINRYPQQSHNKYQPYSQNLFSREDYLTQPNIRTEQYIHFQKEQEESRNSNMVKIQGWFRKLKDLLQDSDND